MVRILRHLGVLRRLITEVHFLPTTPFVGIAPLLVLSARGPGVVLPDNRRGQEAPDKYPLQGTWQGQSKRGSFFTLLKKHNKGTSNFRCLLGPSLELGGFWVHLSVVP